MNRTAPIKATPHTGPADWARLNRAVAAVIADLPPAAPARVIAAEIHLEIIWLDWPAGLIGAQTCPTCAAPCCNRAWVFFDRADLLFLHLRGLDVPGGQTFGPAGRACRFLTDRGCRLARVNRPWLCNWYICPDQIALMTEQAPIALAALESARRRVSLLRRHLKQEIESV